MQLITFLAIVVLLGFGFYYLEKNGYISVEEFIPEPVTTNGN